jgi:predicted nucleotidyltransferase
MKGGLHDFDKLLSLCRENGVARLAVFGSTSRNEAGPDSDVDLLVRFARPLSLLKQTALERRMSEILGRKVDLVSENALSPYLRDKVMRDLRVIYEP